jgi:hypothetical protein
MPATDDEHDLRLYVENDRRRIIFNEKATLEAAERYEKGDSIRDLMEHYSAPYGTVRNMLLGAGVQLRPSGRPRTKARVEQCSKERDAHASSEDAQVP